MENVRIKWYNTVQIVLIDTGEIISKSQYERMNLRIINKSKNYEFKTSARGEKYGISTVTWECREHEQTRMFD